MALNEKQMRFANEYLIDLNATQAAIRAGYSVETAGAIGSENLKKPDIQAYIQQRQAERMERTEITQDKVLRELAIVAFSNTTDYAAVVEKTTIDGNGNPMKYRTVEATLTKDLTEEQKRAIAVLKEGRNGLEVKTYDKVRALELLGKHLGMFTEKVVMSGTVNNPMEGLTTAELKKLISDG